MGAPWWSSFQIEKSSKRSTISEIFRFVKKSLRNPPDYEALGAQHLMTILQSADLHFTVDASDGDGDAVKDSLQAIVDYHDPDPNNPPQPDSIERNTFWVQKLMQISLMMATRLVAYRQATNPSKALTSSLRRFINGLHGFVIDQSSQMHTPAEDARWLDLIARISKDRDQVLVSKVGWQKLLLRASVTQLSQMESDGIGVARYLKMHRLHRGSDSAASIIDLQDNEVETLARLRSRLESTIDRHNPSGGQTMLHKSRTHLFSAKTYFAVAAEVDAVLAGSSDQHAQLVLLMQKKFELLALQEVAVVLKAAVACYQKIASVLESTKGWNDRCVGAIEQVAELYWLQRRTFNVSHQDVDVDIAEFIKHLKPLASLGSSNADMWSPSLFKLQEFLRTGKLPMQSIQYVYDTLLLPKFTDPVAASQFWPNPSGLVGPSTDSPSVADIIAPMLVSFMPSVTKAPVARSPATQPHQDVEFAYKNASIFAAVMSQRDVVRALVREAINAAAKVERGASSLNVDMGKFADLILLPFLGPIREQWSTCLPDYLKAMTRDHDDKRIMDDAVSNVRDRAISKAAPKSLDSAAASLSSSTLFLIQILKAFRLFMQIGAAFVAQKVFNESYVRKVFSEGRDPPPLSSMLFLMLSIDATAHLMLVLILVLSSFAFKTDTNTFVVDDTFLSDLLTEFALSSLVLIILGMMVADIMRRKRYFQYADQGQVVSVAYRSALLYICVINFVVPFSVLIS